MKRKRQEGKGAASFTSRELVLNRLAVASEGDNAGTRPKTQKKVTGGTPEN